MTYRFYITHNAVTTEVFPGGLKADCKIEWESEEGQIFKRRKLKGSLAFNNLNGGADYTLLKAIEDDAFGFRCLEITLNIERACDDITYTNWWSGYFSVTDMEWDLDNCSVKVKDIQPNDEYRCLLEKSKEELNILDAADIYETSLTITTDYEFATCRNTPGSCVGTYPTASGWLLFHTETIDGAVTSIYYREQTVTSCLAGLPNPPSGAGWSLLSNDCATTGLATYVRTPVTVYTNNPNPNVAPGDCDSDGSGGYISAFPPRKKSLTVTRTNTPTTPDIIGYSDVFEYDNGFPFNPEYYYSVPNNPNSTYLWSVVNGSGQVIIISGSTTNEVRVRFTDGACSPAFNVTITCTETHGNGHVSTKSIVPDIVSGGCIPTPNLNFDIIGVEHVCENQTSITFKIPKRPTFFDAPVWSVNNGAVITAGQGTDEITVDAGTTDFVVSVSFLYEITTFVFPKHSASFNVTVSDAARTPDVKYISSVYPNEPGISYEVETRSGATYLWTVSGGAITAGQGTGTVTVNWANTAGSGSITVKESINCGCDFVQISECGASGQPSFYWCPPDGNAITYDQNRLLEDVIDLFLADECELDGLTSDFFEYDPMGDAPGYVAGLNYVTGQTNKVNYLMLAAKSDIIDPSASNPATIAMLDFETLMNFLKEMFQVYWFIDNNKLRLEHISYFNRVSVFNLTTGIYLKWIQGKNKYLYDKPNMPKFERYKWSEAANTDFVGAEIWYDNLCVNQDEKNNILNHAPGNITTDIIYINDSPTEINKEGFVMLANDLVGSTYTVGVEAGLITGLMKPNVHLSWANLHYNYHRHNRVVLIGYMNNTAEVFITARKTRKQVDIKFPFCCDDEIEPLTDLITTFLGAGEMEKLSFDIKTNTMTVDLLHDI